MARPKQTKVSNIHLKSAEKALTAWTDKVENGEFELETGTYLAFKNARDHIKCEVAKQDRKRKRGINVNVVSDPERQASLRKQFDYMFPND